MRLPFRHAHDEPTERPDPDRARAAKEAEQRKLEQMQAETPVYADLAERLRQARHRNHISEGLTRLYRGRRP